MVKRAGDVERPVVLSGAAGERTVESGPAQGTMRPARDQAVVIELFRFNEHGTKAAHSEGEGSVLGVPTISNVPVSGSGLQPIVDFEDESGDASAATSALSRRGAAHPGARAEWFKGNGITLAFGLVAVLALGEAIYIVRSGGAAGANSSAASGVAAGAPPTSAAVSTAAAGTGSPVVAAHVASDVDTPAGRLIIRSDPPGASVSIDGHYQGLTPLTLAGARAGERRVVLALDGRVVEQTIRVEPAGTVSVIAPMGVGVPAASTSSGWVAITAGVDLDIIENGVLVGNTRSPRVMMLAGTHTLRLVSEAFDYETSREIRVDPGKVTQINLTLPVSAISVNAQPWAEVWIDGSLAGETPIGDLPLAIGTHRVVFRNPDFGEKSVMAVVKLGAPIRIAVDMRK